MGNGWGVETQTTWAFRAAGVDDQLIETFKKQRRIEARSEGGGYREFEGIFRKVARRLETKYKRVFDSELEAKEMTFYPSIAGARIEQMERKRGPFSESLAFLNKHGSLGIVFDYVVELEGAKLIVRHDGAISKTKEGLVFQENGRSVDIIAGFGMLTHALEQRVD